MIFRNSRGRACGAIFIAVGFLEIYWQMHCSMYPIKFVGSSFNLMLKDFIFDRKF